MRRAVAAGAAVLAAGLVAAPAGALGATVSVGKACYAEGDQIAVSGTGFTPEATVRLALERASGEELESTAGAEEPRAASDGTVAGDYGVKDETGWFTGSQTRFDMTLRLSEVGNPGLTATTTFIFSRWNVGIRAVGGRIHPARPAGILAVGFTNAVGKPLFAHWMRNGRRVHTRRLGVLRGPCGDLRKRLRVGFPFRPVARGRWEVRFSPSRTNTTRSAIRHRTRVTRRFR